MRRHPIRLGDGSHSRSHAKRIGGTRRREHARSAQRDAFPTDRGADGASLTERLLRSIDA